MRFLVLFLWSVLGAVFPLFSQNNSSFSDTLTDEEIENYFYKRNKFELKIARNQSFLSSGVRGEFTSINIGMNIKQNYRVGGSIFFMAPLKIEPDWSEDVSYYQLSFDGLGGYFEYILLKNYRYEVSFPLQLLSVKAKAEAFDINNRRLLAHDTLSHRFGMMSLGATGSYNFNYWVAISLGFGYRFSLKNYGEQTDPLNTPYYSFGLKIQLGKLYQTVVHHEKVLHLKSIYFRESKPEKSRDLMNRSKRISQRKASKRND